MLADTAPHLEAPHGAHQRSREDNPNDSFTMVH